jgi:hypothetical protein
MMVILSIYSLDPGKSPLKTGYMRALFHKLASLDPLYQSPRFTPEDSHMQVLAKSTTH